MFMKVLNEEEEPIPDMTEEEFYEDESTEEEDVDGNVCMAVYCKNT